MILQNSLGYPERVNTTDSLIPEIPLAVLKLILCACLAFFLSNPFRVGRLFEFTYPAC